MSSWFLPRLKIMWSKKHFPKWNDNAIYDLFDSVLQKHSRTKRVTKKKKTNSIWMDARLVWHREWTIVSHLSHNILFLFLFVHFQRIISETFSYQFGKNCASKQWQNKSMQIELFRPKWPMSTQAIDLKYVYISFTIFCINLKKKMGFFDCCQKYYYRC